MSGLWRPGLPAAVLLSAAYFLILPLALPAPFKAGAALALGTCSALALLFRRKLAHLRRHRDEAAFLGFSCSVKGRLWDPFGAPELLLDKPAGDPEEDRLLYGLVVMHGPDYYPEGPLSGAGQWAAAAAALTAAAMGAFHGLAMALLPLFGLSLLVVVAAEAEGLMAARERSGTSGELAVSMNAEAGYRRWNFLSLEAKRERRGRVRAMEEEIRRVLVSEAGLGAGAAVLEVGAGGGFLWKHAPAELRAGWVQAEKDPYSSLYARRHGNGGSFVSSDVGSLPFAAASFDAVAGLECFDSLTQEDLEAFLCEAMRVLKPGGRLVHLKDFPDWPGHYLAERFNDFAGKALRAGPVRMVGHCLRFEPLPREAPAALRSAAAAERGQARVWGEVLAEIYAAGPGSDPRFIMPMFVSALALRRFFGAAGFKIVSDSLGPAARPGVMEFIVAGKPA